MPRVDDASTSNVPEPDHAVPSTSAQADTSRAGAVQKQPRKKKGTLAMRVKVLFYSSLKSAC